MSARQDSRATGQAPERLVCVVCGSPFETGQDINRTSDGWRHRSCPPPGEAEREARDRAYDELGVRTDNHGWDFKTVGNAMWAAGVEYGRGVGAREEREKTVAEIVEWLRAMGWATAQGGGDGWDFDIAADRIEAEFSSSVALPEQSEREERDGAR